MLWWFAGLGAVLVVHMVLIRVVPPPLWYASGRKRRAMRFALTAFAREHPRSEPVWLGSWVYRTDAEKCFVFVQHRSVLQPPSYAGYVVWHGQEKVDHLGGWQFHWGILPRHAIEWYESRQSAIGR